MVGISVPLLKRYGIARAIVVLYVVSQEMRDYSSKLSVPMRLPIYGHTRLFGYQPLSISPSNVSHVCCVIPKRLPTYHYLAHTFLVCDRMYKTLLANKTHWIVTRACEEEEEEERVSSKQQ